MSTGNIVYPGTPGRSNPGRITSPGIPTPPPRRPGSVLTPGTPPTPASPGVPPAQIGGPAEPRQRGRGAGPRRRARPVVYVPFYYPVYGYDSFGYGAPNVIAVGPGTRSRSSSSHVITVGDDDGREITTDRVAARAEAGEDLYFLIALRGGLIYAVGTYEVEGGTLDVTTLQGERYILPMAEVDLEFTKKLNADRGVEINLEPR